MLDSIINAKIKDNISLSVPLYLMMSYAYYEEDKPIARIDGKEVTLDEAIDETD